MANGTKNKSPRTVTIERTETSNAQGLIVTDIPWPNSPLLVWAKVTSGFYYARVRPSGSNNIVAQIVNDSGQVQGNQTVTLYLAYIVT